MIGQPLDEVVREYLIESGYSTEHKYARFLQIAISGLRELNMDASGVAKAVELTFDSTTSSVAIPDDFITHTKIGICCGGHIQYMGFNNNICLPSDYSSCATTTTNNGSDSLAIVGDFGTKTRNSEEMGRSYGLGGGYSFAEYKFDYPNGLILIKSHLLIDTVYMEYIADPSLVNGDYMIHPYDTEAIKAFIYWKDIQRNKNINGREKESAKMEWLRNKILVRQRHASFTLEEAKQVIRKANKQAPKF
jgi:hypothetical protein